VQPRSQELLNAVAVVAPTLIREAIARFGAAQLRAYGGSMAPAIQPGDLLHIDRIPSPAIRRGDVVLFERDRRLFAHRVVRRTRDELIQTRGDAHFRADPPIAADQILGIVTGVSREGRYLTCPESAGLAGVVWRLVIG
jgi:signal peptidase I